MKLQILVPLDGSNLAETALPHAITVARDGSYSLLLLRAVPPETLIDPMGAGGAFIASSAYVDTWEQEHTLARDYLERMAANLREEGFDVQSELLDGDPALSIVHYCDQHPEVAMVAMATHGRTGIGRWVFGSVAEKVLQASPVPLLMVRASKGAVPLQVEYHTITVPLDGSVFAEQALGHARALANSLSATVVLVTAISDYPETLVLSGPPDIAARLEDDTRRVSAYLDNLAEEMRREGLVVQTRIECGPPAESILKANEEANGDLIVMSTHGRSGLRWMWPGSVALRVMRGTSHPVLLVRAKERVQDKEALLSTQPALAT